MPVTCPSCKRQTIESRETCHYCGAKLPKGFLQRLLWALVEHPASFPETSRQDSFAQDAAAHAEFSMKAGGAFHIAGRGTVVTGKVLSGEIRVGEMVSYTAPNGEERVHLVAAIEEFKTIRVIAAKNDDVGLLLPDARKEEIPPGTLLSKAEKAE